MTSYGPNKYDIENAEIIGGPKYVAEHSSSPSASILDEFTEEEGKRIVRRVDWRLLTATGMMYCISLTDRFNLGSANIAGMSKDLDLDVGNPSRYQIITMVFFSTYVTFQFPAGWLARTLGPRVHLAGIVFLWGCLTIGLAFVQDWQTMAGLRVIFGALEASFFPGCIYLLSTWYVRYEVQTRFALFYILGTSASAFAGILAYGLTKMDGLGGLAGWRWIFIIEGIITVCVAFIGYFLVVGFPDAGALHKNFRFLNSRELDWVVARVNADRGDASAEAFSIKKFLSAGKDLNVWGFGAIFGLTTLVNYSVSFFLPLILRDEMGFSVGLSQILTAPPYIFACIVMYFMSLFADKYHLRAPLLIFNSLVCILGVCLLGWVDIVAVRYIGVFLVVTGGHCNVPADEAYMSNNMRGHWKRAFSAAILIFFDGIGGIIGSLTFRQQDRPQYHPGLYTCITSQVILIVIVCAMSWRMSKMNKRQAKGELMIEGTPGFRYTL